MVELLAAVDPFFAILGSLWLFAAGLYPLGFMFGSGCSPCCGCPCVGEETLPDKVTVTLDGLTKDGRIKQLLSVNVSSCFGSGAAATVSAPGGLPDAKGGLSAITLDNGGTGYARLGRVAPVLTISGSGSGAAFTYTLSTSQGGCGFDFWQLKTVSASGGTGYEDGEQLTIAISNGDTQDSAAAATLYVGRKEPTLAVDGDATATVSIEDDADWPAGKTWRIASVSVTSGGSAWSEGDAVSFTTDPDDITVTAGLGTARVVHAEPENAVLTISTAGGSGAVLTPAWTLLSSDQWPAPHKKTYKLQSVTVTSGGSGYADYELISISFPSPGDGTVSQAAYIDCDVVGAGGVIQAVFIADQSDIFTPAAAGKYIGSRTDALHSVVITNAGSYYGTDPSARHVVVNNGGSYYREDVDAAPYVADVTVSVIDEFPSDGEGAQITVVIDDDTSSATFGEITDLNLVDGGDGYLEWTYDDCDVERLNGRVLTLFQLVSNKCVYEACLFGGTIRVFWRGYSQPPVVQVNTDCDITFTADIGDAPFHCDEMSFTAIEPVGGTATVTAGGVVPLSCEEIYESDAFTVTIDADDFLGTYDIYSATAPNAKILSVTAGFEGSAIAGTYELSYEETVSGVKVWTYYFPAGTFAAECDDPYIEFRMGPLGQEAGLFLGPLPRVLYYDDPDEYHALNELTCDEFGSTGTVPWSRTSQQTLTPTVSCQCAITELVGFSVVVADKPAPSSDEQGPVTTVEAVSEEGLEKVTITAFEPSA